MRYIALLVLNIPIVLLALLNFITKYKLRRLSKRRFVIQLTTWLIILTMLVGSFPIYNLLSNRPPLDSQDLSLFDIVQTTAIVILLYILNGQRQKTDIIDKRLRDLHQEISIILSKKS